MGRNTTPEPVVVGGAPQRELPDTVSGVMNIVVDHGSRLGSLERSFVHLTGAQERQTDILLEIHAGMAKVATRLEAITVKLDAHINDSVATQDDVSRRIKVLEKDSHIDAGVAKVREEFKREYVAPVLRWVLIGILSGAFLYALHMATRGGAR